MAVPASSKVALVVSALALCGCGKTYDDSVSPVQASAAGAETAQPEPDAETPDEDDFCYETPREASDERINAETLAMMALTPDERWVPLYIALTGIEPTDLSPVSTGKDRDTLIAERKAQMEAFQQPFLDRLAALGGTFGGSWLTNGLGGELQAKYVPQLLCWENVLRVEVDGSYWLIAEPPWDDTAAGPEQCPIEDGVCPVHCEPMWAAPVVDGVACETSQATLDCTRIQFGADAIDPRCRARNDTGEMFVFTNLAPSDPGYLGWRECEEPVGFAIEPCDEHPPIILPNQ